MGTPAFPNLGEHCSLPECKLIDFLPFTCDCCQKVYCLEHRTYANHKCPKANLQDVTVLVCPMCTRSVRLVPEEDPNLTWERHVQTNCDPNNYAKVQKKPRCPVPGCKETLTFSNKVSCKNCRREVCLKHRFGLDHNCEDLRRANDKNRSLTSFGNNLMKSFREKSSLGTGAQSNRVANRAAQGTSSAQPAGALTGALAGLQTAASSVRTSMEAGMNRLSVSTNELLNTVTGTSSRRQNPGSQTPRPSQQLRVQSALQREECPQCQAQFGTVGELIQHVESLHGSAPREVLDVCPKCGKGFLDPIALVNMWRGITEVDPNPRFGGSVCCSLPFCVLPSVWDLLTLTHGQVFHS